MSTKDAPMLAAAYLDGATLNSLAAKHGLPYKTVRTAVLSQGVTLRPPKIRIPECPPGMVSMYERGASIRQVGAKYGHSYNQARNMLLDAGVTLRGRGRQ